VSQFLESEYRESLGFKVEQDPSLGIPSLDAMRAIYPAAADVSSPRALYGMLVEGMGKYGDYKDVTVIDNGEPMVAIRESSNLVPKAIASGMIAITHELVYVRSGVADKLEEAGKLLGSTVSNYMRIQIAYGYRDLSLQAKRHGEVTQDLINEGFEGSPEDLIEAAHRRSAVPSVAGHPTGGAVDARILYKDEPLDTGNPFWAFGLDAFTHSPFITEQQWKNRQILTETLGHVGFVNFRGEEWHHSFGDKEWAEATGAPNAIYDQLQVNQDLFFDNNGRMIQQAS
jgi:zinc D-Ala-D-Ala dipeptidase